ncbi:hydrogenase maturation nickel metallochaperone HypA [bacterium]|nr:MAG: hydrogenase maturation nickel metallochaperone HypA [bacterium]
MHEFHAVESLVRQLLKKAESNNAKSISRVRLTLGELSDFTEDSIQLHFKELAKGTILKNADVFIERIKVKLRCKECGISFEKSKVIECPSCKSMDLLIESGREFYIADMELET